MSFWLKFAWCLPLLVSLCFSFDTDYKEYNAFLGRYVCDKGVAYAKLLNDTAIGAITRDFSSLTAGDFEKMNYNEKIAYLINCYNFYTIKLIRDNFPLKTGIKDISRPWGKTFIPLFNKTVSLDYIEHTLLRKQFKEPRIHFALVCASKSCPELASNPYTGALLDTQLTTAAKHFLADTTKNRYSNHILYLSRIFDWYGDDFIEKFGGFEQYILSISPLRDKYTIKYLEYDWSLNQVEQCGK